MRLLILVGVLGLAAAAGADELAVLEARYGHDPIVMVVGNGRLTVGTDSRGRVAALRWPSPGYYDQLSYDRDAGVTGITWGLVRDGQIHWSHEWQWSKTQRAATGARTESNFEAAGLEVRGTARLDVAPGADRLDIRVTLAEPRPEDRIIWYCDLTPTTRKLPELPVADFLLDPLNDFACYVDPAVGGVVHFRPAHPSESDWAQMAQLARSDDVAGSIRFGNGTWIAYSVDQAERYRCFDTTEFDPSALNSTIGGSVAVGAGAASFAIAPVDESSRLTLALAATKEEASGLLAESVPEPVTSEMLPAVETLVVHQDGSTGSVVRSVTVKPPLNRDWPRYGAWVIRAFDMAGHHDRARALVEFYLRNLSAGGERPAGSLPIALYPDGEPAALQSLVDTQGAAWVLWAIGEHAAAMEPPAREAFLETHWSSIARLAGFVADWAEDTSGRPWHAYDPVAGRDRRSRAQVFAGHLALTVALDLAATGKFDVPEAWTRRMRQWTALLESYSRQPGFAFEPAEPLPFWAYDLFPPDHPAVQAAISNRLNADSDMSAGAILRNLAEVALYQAASGAPTTGTLNALRRFGLDPAAAADPSVYTDSYAAALAIVTAYEAGNLRP